jgi:hypothetical protein
MSEELRTPLQHGSIYGAEVSPEYEHRVIQYWIKTFKADVTYQRFE